MTTIICVLGNKLEQLIAALRATSAILAARAYVDTGPISERLAAQQAGLGWLAKNTCLINEDVGSWLFLGVILTSLELAPSNAQSGAPPPTFAGIAASAWTPVPTARW